MVRRRSGLKRNSIGIMQGIFQSMGQVAPAADIAILLVATFSIAGSRTILSVIFGWLVYAVFMVTPYQFSKYKANAGSYYAFAAGSTESGKLGPVTALSFMYYDITGAAFGILGLSSFIFLISPRITAIPYIWILFAGAFTAYITIVTYIGIKPSLGYNAVAGLAEVLFLVIGAIIIILRVGPHNSVVPFTLPKNLGVGFSAIMFGAVFSILDFTGTGIVTTVSEEIKDPKRNIGRSILYAMILTAIAIIPATYALTVGWGISNIGSFASAPDAGIIVFGKYLGTIGVILLIIFTINSYLTNGVSKATAVGRWWYSAAGDNVIFPKVIARIHPKYRSPYMAIIVWSITSFVLDVLMGLYFGPKTAAFILEAGTGISIIIVHIMANTSLTYYTRRINRFEFLKHALAPAVATVIGLVVIYFTVSNIWTRWVTDPTPVNDAYFASFIITILWVVIGGMIVTLYYSRKRPEILKNAGEFDVENAKV
ncbi:amino acid transporter [Thermoplasma sp. Kam2015]|uniref:amino acid permease n=1 Tax=Thermoplasma sp. Kam2015 TaxID=2094122 RepID=UPI000D975C1C|nr:amino acid permease [Thermoplasma sp. Kam2015]PYB67901.1 amino acid transporter [Thermoplasma sp. Kam2015]